LSTRPGAVVEPRLRPAPLLAQLEHPADVGLRAVDREPAIGSAILDLAEAAAATATADLELLSVRAVTLYTTDGAVVMRSRSYSRSSRSCTISMWSRPRNPTRKPSPSASEVSGSIADRAVVELELLERVLEVVVVLAVGRVDAREHHRLDLFEPGQRLGGAAEEVVTVSPTGRRGSP
jgi:hypothetical protein